MGAAGPAQIQQYLEGAGYPATREELIEVAKRNGAGTEVLGALGKLGEGPFISPGRVSEALGEVQFGLDIDHRQEAGEDRGVVIGPQEGGEGDIEQV
ncbi:MAG: DUF2795 domain-containing protein [Actinomycetota bacterium]|nr:DUF2795 domain-containing protein [Actinomycetota bacterium]